MRKGILCLFMSLACIPSIAQKDTAKVRHNTWAIKGKILPWISPIPDFAGINYTLGAEYGFRRNAIGIDLVYNDNNTHKDYSSRNGNDSAGPNSYTVSRGVFLYYRRYLDVSHTFLSGPVSKIFNDCKFLPYISAFVRYGKTDDHYAPGYITSNVSLDEWQYSGGFLVGAVIKCIDVNMGPFYKQTYSSDVETEGGANELYSHMKPSFGFRVGVNLFLEVKKNGYQ